MPSARVLFIVFVMALVSGMISVKTVLMLLVLFVCVIAFVVFRHQERFLYHPDVPTRQYVKVPSDEPWEMDYESVRLKGADAVEFDAWFVRHPTNSATAPTLVFFHGNAGNIAFRLPNVYDLVHEVGVNVFQVEYRGYGQSQGAPSCTAFKSDAVIALSHVLSRTDIDTRRVIVFGRSLGGAVAIDLASHMSNRIAGLIVENTFTNIPSMIRQLMPIFTPFRFLVRIRWNSIDTIKSVTAPILFLSGLRDSLVPPTMMKQLHDAATAASHRSIMTFEAGEHNDTWRQEGYMARLKDYIQTLVPVEALSDDIADAADLDAPVQPVSAAAAISAAPSS